MSNNSYQDDTGGGIDCLTNETDIDIDGTMSSLYTNPLLFGDNETDSDAEGELDKNIEEQPSVTGDNRHDQQGIYCDVNEDTAHTDVVYSSFTCKICGEEFEIESKLRAHVMLHSEDKVYKCQFCYKLFGKRSNLSSHLRVHTGEKPFHCKICSKTFAWMHSVRTHVPRVHKVEKELIENFIGNDHVPEDSNVDRGQADSKEVNNGENDVPLSIGNRKERIEGDILLDVEHNDKQIHAEYKDMENYIIKTQVLKIRSDSNSVSDNMKFIEKKKVTYICKHCKKEVSQRSNMIDHVRSHLGVKRFKCKLCGKDLSRKQNLVHHLKYVHFIDNSSVKDMIIQNDETLPRNTNVFQKGLNISKAESMDLVQFEENDELEEKKNADIEHQEGMLFKNVLCNENVGNEDGVKMLSTDKEKCAVSDMNHSAGGDFVDTDVEVKYEVIEGDTPAEKMYLCKICGFTCDRRYYMTNEHIMKHTGAKRYQCVICSKTYTRKFVFRRHILKEHDIKDEALDSFFDASEIDKKKKRSPGNISTSDKRSESQPFLAETKSADENGVNFDEISFNSKKRKHSENDGTTLDGDSDSDKRVELNGDYPKTDLEFSFTRVPVNNPNKFAYKCNLCGFVCTRKYYMVNMHYLKHTGGKPYLCVVCCKLYSRRYVLRKHLVKEHGIKGGELEDLLETTGKRLNPADGLPEAIHDSNVEEDFSKGRETGPRTKKGELNSADSDMPGTDEKMQTKEVLESVLEPREERLHLQDEKIDSKIDNINPHSDQEDEVETNYVRTRRITRGKRHLRETENRNVSDMELETSMQDGDNGRQQSRRNTKTSKQHVNNEAVDESVQMLNNESDSDDHVANGQQSKRVKKYESPFEQVVRSLMDLKTLTCLKCNKKCSKKSNLKQHIRILHFNLKEYSCQECKKTFNTKYNLKVHMKQHLQPEDRDSMNEECYICKKAFTTKSYLKVHLTKYHGVKSERTQKDIHEKNESLDEDAIDIPFMDEYVDAELNNLTGFMELDGEEDADQC